MVNGQTGLSGQCAVLTVVKAFTAEQDHVTVRQPNMVDSPALAIIMNGKHARLAIVTVS